MPKDLDLDQIAEAVTEVKKGWETFKETHADEMKEAAKGAVDVLLTEKLEKINKDLGEKQEKIDELYAASRRKTVYLDGKQVDEEELDTKAFQWADTIARRSGTRIQEYRHEDLESYKSAFLRYIRKDDKVLSGDEQKALSVGTARS